MDFEQRMEKVMEALPQFIAGINISQLDPSSLKAPCQSSQTIVCLDPKTIINLAVK